MIKVSVLVKRGLQSLRTSMAKRGVANVMSEAKRLGQIFIKSQHTSDRAPDLRHFQAVGQADTIMVAVRGNEDLRLMPKAPEAAGMNDAIAVALKCIAGSEEHTSELQSLMPILYAVFRLTTNIHNNDMMTTA